jgi:hypothetical protein
MRLLSHKLATTACHDGPSLVNDVVVLRLQSLISIWNNGDLIARCIPNTSLVLMNLIDVLECPVQFLDREASHTVTRWQCGRVSRYDGRWGDRVGHIGEDVGDGCGSVTGLRGWNVDKCEADDHDGTDDKDEEDVEGEGVVVFAAQGVVRRTDSVNEVFGAGEVVLNEVWVRVAVSGGMHLVGWRRGGANRLSGLSLVVCHSVLLG